MEANDEVWEKNLSVAAQGKSNLINSTDKNMENYQRITEMRTRPTSRRSRSGDLRTIVGLRTLHDMDPMPNKGTTKIRMCPKSLRPDCATARD